MQKSTHAAETLRTAGDGCSCSEHNGTYGNTGAPENQDSPRTAGAGYTVPGAGPQGPNPAAHPGYPAEGLNGPPHPGHYAGGGTHGYIYPAGPVPGGPYGQPFGYAGPSGNAPGMGGPWHIPAAGFAYGPYGPQAANPGPACTGFSHGPGAAPHAHAMDPGSPHGPGHAKHEGHQYGQMMSLVNDLVNGNADASRVMNFIDGVDNHFWKGALVGMSVTLLLTNDTVKNAIVDTLSGIWGAFDSGNQKAHTESTSGGKENG